MTSVPRTDPECRRSILEAQERGDVRASETEIDELYRGTALTLVLHGHVKMLWKRFNKCHDSTNVMIFEHQT